MSATIEMTGNIQAKNVTEKERNNVLAGMTTLGLVRRLKAGETLIAEGEQGRYCYRIVSGVVKEFNTIEDGQRQITDFYQAGEFVGFDAVPGHEQAVEAVTECAVQCISRDLFFRSISSSTEMSQLVIELLLNRVNRAHRRMMMIARKSARERVAAFLVQIADEQRRTTNLSLAMSRQDIADYLGLTIETVCRSLTELKKEGVIVMSAARVFTIVDRSRLEAVAGSGQRLH